MRLLNGLRELDYRGYDSAGPAFRATLDALHGAYAILLISEAAPSRIDVARQGSPQTPVARVGSRWTDSASSPSPRNKAAAPASSTAASIVPELSIPCHCRKPEPGMLPSALRDWPIDPTRAYLIGDKASDLEAAERAGVQGIRYDGTTSPKVLLEDRVSV